MRKSWSFSSLVYAFPYGVPGKIWYVIVSIPGFSFFLVIRCARDLEIIF